MNKKYAFLGLLVICVIAFNRFQHSDYRIEKILTSNKWHSSDEIYISPSMVDNNEWKMGEFSTFYVDSNIKYLTNMTYIRESYIELHRQDSDEVIKINIADLGSWSVNDGYIFIEPDEYIDIGTSSNKDMDTQRLMMFKQLFEMETKQIRHLDKINRKTLLLTGIDNSSRVMFSN